MSSELAFCLHFSYAVDRDGKLSRPRKGTENQGNSGSERSCGYKEPMGLPFRMVDCTAGG